ncbi:hypothetical protein IQ225_19205 [Synechocystis salina LEGE 06155]|nr:hypothetical protein [Synechocystis salina LEGE 06155]
MSLGIVIAHKSVPLPTVLESIWSAEKERSKQMTGAGPERCQRFNESLNIENEEILKQKLAPKQGIPYKDGICFRVIYGSGNTLESLMKGHLLESWWDFIKVCLIPTTAVNSKPDSKPYQSNIGPLLHRLAEILSQHGLVTEQTLLIQKATEIVLMHRDEQLDEDTCQALITWLNQWETWAWLTTQDVLENQDLDGAQPLGTRIEDLVCLLRFSAFMVERLEQHQTWQKLESQFH